MPKVVIPSVDDFSEEDRKHAVKNEDGTFTIDVRPTAVVTEFRDRNLKQTQTLESLTTKVQQVAGTLGVEIKDITADFDAEAMSNMLVELTGIKKKVDDGTLVADTSLEAAIATRTNEMKADYEKRINDLTKVNTEFKVEKQKMLGDMDDYILTNEITQAVLSPDSGVRPEALPDVLSRAKQQAKIGGDKKLVFLDGEQKVRYGADAEAPMTKAEWIRETLEKAPHFSKTSGGGDADNTTRTGVEAMANSSDTEGFVSARMKQLNSGA